MMRFFNLIKYIYRAKNQHYLWVPIKDWNRYGFILLLFVIINKNYKECVIFRKKFKNIENFVVIGLKWSGKNVRRRTLGFAKNFLINNETAKCIYCDILLDNDNATADHIIPVSKGGNNCQVNIVVCCKQCNGERGNKHFNDFIVEKKPEYKKKRFIF
jgi:5-methylcytosine-specific restriction endonuclease McrA